MFRAHGYCLLNRVSVELMFKSRFSDAGFSTFSLMLINVSVNIPNINTYTKMNSKYQYQQFMENVNPTPETVGANLYALSLNLVICLEIGFVSFKN